MDPHRFWQVPALAAALIALAALPLVANAYYLTLAIGMMQFVVLATAWALFSGPTRYISLATAAFFGVGSYTVAVLSEALPLAAIVVVAALIGVAVSVVVGLATLRLRGIFFVIFTFGLAELMREVVRWYEVNQANTVGRYIFMNISSQQIYWELLALTVLVFVVGWLIMRSRLGLAVRVIGDDETVARHVAINTTTAKLVLFAVSAAFISATGAVMAPRYTYIDPAFAFNPIVSFQVVIMALLGGAGVLYGPLLGVVPLVLINEFISSGLPRFAEGLVGTLPFLAPLEPALSRLNVPLVLGVVFIIIVYFAPQGIVGLVQRWRTRATRLPPVPVARRMAYEAGPLLQVSDLRKAFGGVRAVDGVDLTVEQGEILGLIGPNGSGKTTALNLISGALKPDVGDIRFRGLPIAGLPSHQIARLGVARTFQIVRALESMNCRDNVVAGLAFRPDPLWGEAANERATALLDRVGLGPRADVPAGQLTYIDQKRLELARALALEPELLLLDEWLAGLNPRELGIGIELVGSLRREGLTIVLVEHVMDAIRSLCDRCVVMNAGQKIADGPPDTVLAEREVIAAYIGDAVA